jgi:hypothetical protein
MLITATIPWDKKLKECMESNTTMLLYVCMYVVAAINCRMLARYSRQRYQHGITYHDRMFDEEKHDVMQIGAATINYTRYYYYITTKLRFRTYTAMHINNIANAAVGLSNI